MKKALIFLFVLTIIFTLCACSSTEESDIQSVDESPTEQSVGENSSTEESVAEESVGENSLTEESVSEESVGEESSTDEDSDYNISYMYDEYSGNLKRITKTSKKIAEAKKSGTVDLTLEKLIDISVKKGNDLSWCDFEEFISKTTVEKSNKEYVDADGIYNVIENLGHLEKTYELDDEKSLVISGNSLSAEPQNMFLVVKDNAKNKNYSYDIRNGNIEKVLQNGIDSLIDGEKIDFENRTVKASYNEENDCFENYIGNLSKGIDGSHHVILINSEEELNKMITYYKNNNIYFTADYEAMEDIDFKKYSVLIVPVISGSGSNKISISEIRKNGNTLYLDLKSEMPEIGNAAMASWWVFSIVKKSDLDGVEKASASFRWFGKDGYEVYYSTVAEDNRPAYITCYRNSRISFITGGLYSNWFYGNSWREGDIFYLSETKDKEAVFAFRLDGDTFVFEPSLSTKRAKSWLGNNTTFIIEPPHEVITIYYTK